MRKIGYLRVSTKKQKHDRQVHALRRYCDRLFTETASAASLDRPVYDKVTRMLGSGDELVILDIDRAYRNTRDALNEFHVLSLRGVRMKVLNFPIDLNTDEGYYSFVMENARAELERRRIGRRTREGLAVARAKGKRLGRPCKLTVCQIDKARRRLQAQEATITAMARELQVGRWTLTRALKRSLSRPKEPHS
jgi:DNA invertase Pin-like site-specific DNA recombinase